MTTSQLSAGDVREYVVDPFLIACILLERMGELTVANGIHITCLQMAVLRRINAEMWRILLGHNHRSLRGRGPQSMPDLLFEDDLTNEEVYEQLYVPMWRTHEFPFDPLVTPEHCERRLALALTRCPEMDTGDWVHWYIALRDATCYVLANP